MRKCLFLLQALFFISVNALFLKLIMLLIFLYIVNLFRTLLFFVLIFLIVRWFTRLMNPKPSGNNGQQSGPQEGETTIRYNKKGEKIIDKDKGEYVDFEEID